jgi:hypothetical protein
MGEVVGTMLTMSGVRLRLRDRWGIARSESGIRDWCEAGRLPSSRAGTVLRPLRLFYPRDVDTLAQQILQERAAELVTKT